MKKSSVPSSEETLSSLGKETILDFELPDGAGFDSQPPRMDPDQFIESCAQWLPRLLARPEFWARREAERCPAEFDLADPSRMPITYPAQLVDDLLRR